MRDDPGHAEWTGRGWKVCGLTVSSDDAVFRLAPTEQAVRRLHGIAKLVSILLAVVSLSDIT